MQIFTFVPTRWKKNSLLVHFDNILLLRPLIHTDKHKTNCKQDAKSVSLVSEIRISPAKICL